MTEQQQWADKTAAPRKAQPTSDVPMQRRNKEKNFTGWSQGGTENNAQKNSFQTADSRRIKDPPRKQKKKKKKYINNALASPKEAALLLSALPKATGHVRWSAP